jgi:hypothetical protein
MTILLPALALAFGAFCVWLVVRIVNRRERWAKWTLGAVVGVPVLYVLSFGRPGGYSGNRGAPEQFAIQSRASMNRRSRCLTPHLDQ